MNIECCSIRGRHARLYIFLAALLLSTINFQPSTCFAQGSLIPSGAPAPTMKSLDQIEARTTISSPFTISASGSYYLTKNLSVATGEAIVIAADNVTLDLNGFTITSTAASATGDGIVFNGARRNITILNGFITGGVVNNGGVYSGSGFSNGIYNPGFLLSNVRVSGVSVSGCLNGGIDLGSLSHGSVVENCTVATAGGFGIFASAISNSSAVDCGFAGIYADVATSCYGQSSIGAAVHASSTAINCSGIGTGTGADNQGVYAVTASNCYGTSISSQGIYAETATNCRGYSTQNRGIFTNVAMACSGECAGGSYGLFATSVANTCYGYSSSGTGLNAYIAIGCFGDTGSGNSVGYFFHYNMPPSPVTP